MKQHFRLAVVLMSMALIPGASLAAKDSDSDSDSGGTKRGPLTVTEVFVDFNAETIEITGTGFDCGELLTVELGELGDISSLCTADFTPPQLISCDFSAGGLPPDGDYLLTVACGKDKDSDSDSDSDSGKGKIQSDEYDLTIGAVGPQGPQGPQGKKGDPGLQGVQGKQGDVGDQRPQGKQGDPGAAGDQGPQGKPGAPGGQGPQGKQGPPGTARNERHLPGKYPPGRGLVHQSPASGGFPGTSHEKLLDPEDAPVPPRGAHGLRH